MYQVQNMNIIMILAADVFSTPAKRLQPFFQAKGQSAQTTQTVKGGHQPLASHLKPHSADSSEDDEGVSCLYDNFF